jgi:Arc/MetJ family transcription regulator
MRFGDDAGLLSNAAALARARGQPAEVREFCAVDEAGANLLRAAMQQRPGGTRMSARAYADSKSPTDFEAGADDCRPFEPSGQAWRRRFSIGRGGSREVPDLIVSIWGGDSCPIHTDVIEYTHHVRRYEMRTNVVIDDDLMAEALESTGLNTKKAVIEEALRTLVRLKKQEQVRSLRGKLQWEGDLNILRESRFADVDC